MFNDLQEPLLMIRARGCPKISASLGPPPPRQVLRDGDREDASGRPSVAGRDHPRTGGMPRDGDRPASYPEGSAPSAGASGVGVVDRAGSPDLVDGIENDRPLLDEDDDGLEGGGQPEEEDYDLMSLNLEVPRRTRATTGSMGASAGSGDAPLVPPPPLPPPNDAAGFGPPPVGVNEGDVCPPEGGGSRAASSSDGRADLGVPLAVPVPRPRLRRGGGRRRGRGWGSGPRGPAYEAVEIPSLFEDGVVLGRIKVNLTRNSLDAHCEFCKAKANRTFKFVSKDSPKGRPMGMLLTWLLACPGTTAADHKDLALSEMTLHFEERSATRENYSTMPALGVLFGKERAPHTGEGPEPPGLV